jgi:hypothetical protein
MIEVELLARKPTGPKEIGLNQCLLLRYLFRTRPEMTYSQEYQKGPLHLGRVEVDFRVYAWSNEEIENYKRMREQEDFQLLGLIDTSVKAAMESLGDELMRYLKEAGEEFGPKTEKPEGKKPSFLSPYTSVFGGFKELFGSRKVKAARPKKKTKTQLMKESLARDDVADVAKATAWTIYHHFKKHHDMLNW